MSAKDLSDKILWRAKYARECSKRFQAHQILPYIITPPSLPNVPSPRPPVYSDRPPLHDVPAPIPIISSSVTTPGAGEAGDVPALRAAAAATAEDPNNLVVGIIGAGVAGLYTAMILKDLGINYKIIEGSDRSGGRILTHHFTESDNEWNYFDVGAMRYPDIKVMWRVFDLFRNRLNIGDRLISYIMKSPNQFLDYNRQLVQQRDYDGAPHSADKFKDSENNDGLVPQEFVDQGVDHWLGQCFGPFKTLFAEDWQRGWDKLMEYDGYSARSFMATEFNDRDGEFVLQKPRYDNAVINWMERMNTGTGLFDMAFSEMVIDDLQFDWPNSSGVKYGAAADPDGQWYCLRGGSEVFIRAMENTLQTSIQLNKRVTKIEPTPKGVPGRPMTVTYSQNKVKATADFDYVVSTVPLPALRFVDLEYCNLSYAQLEGMRTLRYDSSCKVGIRFSSRWWKDLPTGQIVGGQSKTDRIIRTAVFPSYGVSTGGSGEPTNDPDADAVMIASYTWSQDAARVGGLMHGRNSDTEEFLIDSIVQDLALMHGKNYQELRADVQNWCSFDWYTDPYTLGAFALFGPGQFQNIYPSFSESAAGGRLLFAGEAISDQHAWVEGALNSAYAAVDKLLHGAGLHADRARLEERWGNPNLTEAERKADKDLRSAEEVIGAILSVLSNFDDIKKAFSKLKASDTFADFLTGLDKPELIAIPAAA